MIEIRFDESMRSTENIANHFIDERKKFEFWKKSYFILHNHRSLIFEMVKRLSDFNQNLNETLFYISTSEIYLTVICYTKLSVEMSEVSTVLYSIKCLAFIQSKSLIRFVGLKSISFFGMYEMPVNWFHRFLAPPSLAQYYVVCGFHSVCSYIVDGEYAFFL